MSEKVDKHLVINWTVNVLALLIGTVLIYWQFTAKPFLSYPTLPATVLHREVWAGQRQEAIITRCNDNDLARVYTTTQELVNVETGLTITFQPGLFSIPPGCSTVVRESPVIPETTPSGIYYFKGTVAISDYWSTRFVKWRSVEFHVRGRDR